MNRRMPVWKRGRAAVDGAWLAIDTDTIADYSPYESSTIDTDLAAVRTQRDAVAFVERYGLLKHGEPDASGRLREAWDDFAREAGELRAILALASVVSGFTHDDEDQRRLLREVCEPMIRSMFEAPASSDKQIALQATQAVAWMVSDKLADVQHGIDVSNGPGRYMLTVRAPTLLGYIYQAVAQKLVERRPLRVCRECGNVFAVDGSRNQYCSAACSKRRRQRTWRAKGKGGIDGAKTTRTR